MPFLIAPIIGAAAMSGMMAAGVAGITTASIWGTFIVSSVLSGVSMLLQPKPSTGANMGARTITQKNTQAPRDFVYGTVVKGGTVIFETKTGDSGGDDGAYLHQVIVLAGHPCDGIANIRLGNRMLVFNTSGDTSLVSTSQEIFQSVAYPQIGATSLQMRANWNYLSGQYLITWADGTTTNANFTKNSASVSWATALVAAREGEFCVANPGSDPSYNSNGSGSLKINIHLGDQTTVDSDLNTASPTLWDSTHVGYGCTYIYCRFRYSSTLWPDGIDNISVKIRGKKVLDTRTSVTAFSSNPIMCLRDFLCDTTFGLKTPAANIDTTSFNEAANICDEQILKADGTYENNFTCNYSSNSQASPDSVINDIRTSFGGGTLVPTGGLWICHAAAWRTPESVGLSETDILKFQYQANLSKRDSFNTITGNFISPENSWQVTNYTTISSASYIALDGQVITKDFPLPATNSDSMAQRIATMELLKTRLPITVQCTAKLYAMRYQVGDVIPFSWQTAGWVNKYFEIINLSIVQWEGQALAVELTLRETAQAVFNWSTSIEQTARLTPSTNLPSSKVVPPPTNFIVTSGTNELYIKSDGTVVTRAHLNWTLATWATVNSGGCYNIQYKRSSDSIWIDAGSPVGGSTDFYIQCDDGVKYDFQIQSQSVMGVKSTWVQITNYMVIGKTQPPATPTAFSLNVASDGTRVFSIIPVNEPDLAGCIIGWSTNLSDTFANMQSSGQLLNNGALLAFPYETNQLSAGTYLFAAVAIDTSGNQSAPIYITMAIGSPRIAGAIAVYNYPTPLGYNGNGSWTSGYGSRLVGYPTTTQTWDALTTWDAFTNWLQNYNTPLVYTTNVLDIGVIINFTPLVSAQCQGTPTYQIKTSNDNVTWSGWQTINATYTARYIQVQTSIASASSLPPILFNQQIIASASPKSETISNVNSATVSTHTGTGAFTVPLTKSYNIITSVVVMFAGSYAGYTSNVVNKNTTGPLINLFNGSNAAADAIVDIIITGL